MLDCHGELEKYNPQHPVGTKYRFIEIKTRRNQIYDKFTLPYVRQAEISISKYTVSGHLREIGDTSCTVRTLSQDLPIKLRIKMIPYHNNQKLNIGLGELYEGKAVWNINPSQIVFGHFRLPIATTVDPFYFSLEIFWSIIDILEREHTMLPFSFVWNNPDDDWWYDPRVLFEKG